MKAIILDEAKKWLEENCENQYTRMAVFGIIQSMTAIDVSNIDNGTNINADLLARAETAEAKAEKAERERDAAIQDMRGICYLCANAKPYSALSRTMMSCEYKQVLASIKSPRCEHFKWRGERKE